MMAPQTRRGPWAKKRKFSTATETPDGQNPIKPVDLHRTPEEWAEVVKAAHQTKDVNPYFARADRV